MKEENTKNQSNPSASYAIDTLQKIEVNGTYQYVLIRGKNSHNPILLFVHGGPGQGEIGYMYDSQQQLEEAFIVVRWDQRGAGLSGRDCQEHQKMTREIMIQDVLDVTDYLRATFSMDKIYISGHSWGTIIATHAVYEHPEKYAAYIGVSQFVDGQKGEVIAYNETLKEAQQKEETEVIEMLRTIGEPPYDVNACLIRARCMGMLGMICHTEPSIDMHEAMMQSPYYDNVTKNLYYENALASTKAFIEDIMTVSFLNNIIDFHIPIYLIVGRFDYNTPLELIQEYYNQIQAPKKECIIMENAGHLPQLEETVYFSQALIRIKEQQAIR